MAGGNGGREWRPASPALQDEHRLLAALVFSALLHAFILTRFSLPREIAQHGDRSSSVLTVTLVTQKPAASLAAPEAKPEAQAVAVIALRNPAKSPQRLSVKTSPASRERNGAAATGASSIRGSQVVSQGRGKLQVLLVIDGSGRVGQIHWYQLPAMTEEEFHKLEQRLRQKIYLPSGVEYTVTEQVE